MLPILREKCMICHDAEKVKGGLDVRTSFSPVAANMIAGPVRVDNQNGSVEVLSDSRQVWVRAER